LKARIEKERLIALHLAEQQRWRESVEEEKKNILHKTRLEMKVVMERINEKSEVLKDAAEQEALRIIERGKEDVRRAKAENANNVRVLEAMEVFKRTVKKDVEEKIALQEQKKLAKKKLEEAAVKRQRAEASLRAKKEAQKRKEQQQLEAKHSKFVSRENAKRRAKRMEDDDNYAIDGNVANTPSNHSYHYLTDNNNSYDSSNYSNNYDYGNDEYNENSNNCYNDGCYNDNNSIYNSNY
jgi:hypothetical protein